MILSDATFALSEHQRVNELEIRAMLIRVNPADGLTTADFIRA